MRFRGVNRRGAREQSGKTLGQRFAVLLAAKGQFWFDADNVTTSSGNVVTFVDKVDPSRNLAVSGTLTAPTSDAAMAGAKTAAFTGTQIAISNQPASSFKFLHDGTSCEVFDVFVETAALQQTEAHAGTLNQTTNGGWGPGAQFYTNLDTDLRWFIGNGTNTVLSATGSSNYVVGTGTFTHYKYGEGSSPEFTASVNAGAVVSGDSTGVPSNSNPTSTLTLGAFSSSGENKGTFRFRAFGAFTALTSAERALVISYIRQTTGIQQTLNQQFASLFQSGDGWYDADHWTSSDGGVTVSSFTDVITPSRTLAVTGSLPAPTSDAALGTAKTVTYDGTQIAVSNQTAASWAFLSDGTGGTAVHVFVPTTVAAGSAFFCSTRAQFGAGQDSGYSCARTGSGTGFAVTNADAVLFNVNVAAQYSVGTGTYAHDSYVESASPEYVSRIKSTTIASGTTASAPGSTPSGTLAIGGASSGALKGAFRWRASFFFRRVLSPSEITVLQSYIQATTGIAP